MQTSVKKGSQFEFAQGLTSVSILELAGSSYFLVSKPALTMPY